MFTILSYRLSAGFIDSVDRGLLGDLFIPVLPVLKTNSLGSHGLRHPHTSSWHLSFESFFFITFRIGEAIIRLDPPNIPDIKKEKFLRSIKRGL